MRPSSAEVARTLARGRLLGALHVAGYGRLRVRHATGASGDPYLLTRDRGELADALGGPAADRPLVLSVDDVAPVVGAPGRGRPWLSGYAARLAGAEALAAADEYATLNPTGDLLDVGRGFALFRLRAHDVRLANGNTLVEVDVDDFRAARPDPMADEEERLLADLNDHHREQLGLLVERVCGRSAGADCRAVRLDRYGLVVAPATPGPRMRLGFPRPVDSVCEVVHLVHALLWHSSTVEVTPS
jgi:heme iron utilization protein